MPIIRRTFVIASLLIPPAGSAGATATMANPAAVLCVANGATIVIETAANGAQRGICVFPDGTHIDEWAYFRNKHRTQK